MVDWTATASAPPDHHGFTAVSTAHPDHLTGRQVIDLIVTAEHLIGHLQAAQLTAIADLTRPGRAAPIHTMHDLLHHKIGPDTPRDPAATTAHLEDLGRSLAATEIAAALHQSHPGATARVALAVELAHDLPATLAAVSDGRIDIARARTIADRTRLLPTTDRHQVEAAVLPLAATRTPGQLNPMIDRRVIAIDPAAAHHRTITARRERTLDHRPAPDGMGDIHAHLPAEAALDVYHLLDQLAIATTGQDHRPATARRADALTDLCTALLTDGHIDLTALLHPTSDPNPDHAATDHTATDVAGPPADTDSPTARDTTAPATAAATAPAAATTPQPTTAEPTAPGHTSPPPPAPKPRPARIIASRHGRPVHLNLTMTLAAFAGLRRDPAVLTGHGAITADLAAAIARSLTTLSVHLTDPDGRTTAVGATTTYTPSTAITDHVLAAAGTCRFPSCRMPAYRCDLDHRIPYDHTHPERGGHTHPDNLDPLCRHHHHLKTHTPWTAHRDPTDGLTMIWTSPTNHTYTQQPPTHPTTDWTPHTPTPNPHTANPPDHPQRDHPQPDDFDHIDDPTPQPPPDDHTCHLCTACTATGPSITIRTRDAIENAAARTLERHQHRQRPSQLSPHATLTYRIGLNEPGFHDNTDDDEDNYDIHNDPTYQPPTDAFLRRFCPDHYQHLQQQRHHTHHPDPDQPPF